MSPVVLLLADILVGVLLVATVVTSVGLSRRIARLKADEAALRLTIGELMIATETAERAIAGLRSTLGDCDRTLGERLRTAERYAADLAEQVEAGETLMGRIMTIVESSRRVSENAPEPRPAARDPLFDGISQPLAEPAPQRARPPEPRIVQQAPPPPAPVAEDVPLRPVSERISAAAQLLAERAARRFEAHSGAA